MCARCGVEAPTRAVKIDHGPHYAKEVCAECGSFIAWLKKPKNNGKRPANKHAPESLGIDQCQLCGREWLMLGDREVLEVHHVVAIQDGGEDTPGNIWVLCTDCHRTVHHRRTYLRDHHRSTMTLARLRELMEADAVPENVRPVMEKLFERGTTK